MAKNASAMSDDKIVALLQEAMGDAVGSTQTKLSRERERVLRYYNGDRPGPAHKGDSEYKSLDVFDSVQSMVAQLLEVFSGNNQPVVFTPALNESDDQARIRSDRINHIILSENKGFQLFQTIITDGLLNRNGIVKVWWDEKVEDEDYDLSEPASQDIIGVLMKDPTAKITQVEHHDDGETLKRVRISCKKDRSQVRIKPLPPEEFGISPMAESIEAAEVVFHRHAMSVSDLIKHGYDKKLVMSLQDDARLWLEMDPERIARFRETDDQIGSLDFQDSQNARRMCTVFECYMNLDVDGTGTSQLYKVDIVGNVLLDKQPVSYKPFVAFCPLPEPHSFWGTNFSRLVIDIQNAKTYLARSIINHGLITNNPRMMVANGGVMNPRELMENRFGGIVNVRSLVDSVAPMPQAGLNPFVFQTIQALQADKEQLTGISALSQGLNKDAISKQNSADMVNDLINASQTRQKIIARNFAELFLRDLYTLVYKLEIANRSANQETQISGGKWMAVDYTQWPDDVQCDVEFKLGLGEQQQEFKKWMAIDQYMSAPANGLMPLYPIEKRFFVLQKMAQLSGIKDVTTFALTPQQAPPPPPPSPMEQADLQVKQADAKVKLANAQAAAQGAQLALQEAQWKQQEAQAKMTLERMKVLGQQQIEQDKLAHNVAVDAAEISLEQQTLAQQKLAGVAKPVGA